MTIKTINKNGYNLHLIKTKKFKTTVIKVIFWNEMKKEDLSLTNLLLDNLLFSSSKYKTKREMNIKKNDLYNARTYNNTYIKGSHLISEYNLLCIDDKYTEKGNLEKAIEFFLECITKPNIKNEEFDKKSFDICKEQLLTAQQREVENPSFIAHREFRKMLNEEKIYSGSYLGTAEETKKITPKSLYQYHQKMFKENHIDIFIAGDIQDSIEQIIDKYLKLEKTNIPYKETRVSYQKDFSELVYESNFSQSIIKMSASLKGFTKDELHYYAPVYSMILGNGPSSKLFQNVREKLSYCYHISSTLYSTLGFLEINAGISAKNYEHTKEEVLTQINEMKKGNFSEKDVKQAKEYLLSTINEITDSANQIINYYFNKLYFYNEDIEIEKSKIKAITKEDIIKIAKKINIDTIFLLKEDQNGKDKN